MKERPILFNAAMVNAVLAGTKKQTRRIAKKVVSVHSVTGEALADIDSAGPRVACPLGTAGDRLYVRETFVQGWPYDPVQDCLLEFDDDGNQLPKKTWYRATDDINWSDDDGWQTDVPWKPSIHMPRAVSRIDLEVTGVRVERLQDISEADAKAEGAQASHWLVTDPRGADLIDWPLKERDNPYRNGFALLWVSIYGQASWDANPWVWVTDFKRA